MIVMQKVRSGDYYTSKDKDGYASIEREGKKIELHFEWVDGTGKEVKDTREEDGKGKRVCWAWGVLMKGRKRQIWRDVKENLWREKQRRFSMMMGDCRIHEKVRERLDEIITAGGVVKRGGEECPDGEDIGFFVVEQEGGGRINISTHGGDVEAVLGTQGYEKIKIVMELFTSSNKKMEAKAERENTLTWRGDISWVDGIRVVEDSRYIDRRGTDNVWWGGLAERLNIKGAVVGKDDFNRVLEGYAPGLVDGKRLAVMKNSGHPLRKKGTDIVFSAPKAYSLLWGSADEKVRYELERLNREKVCEALEWWVHKGLGYINREREGDLRLEKDILVGMFEHSSSRGKDPHLHTHCVLANLTTYGRRLVINNRYTLAAGYVYWRGLCEGLQQMGYDARPDMVRGVWIKGVSQEQEEQFSRRRRLILELARGGGARTRKRIALLTRKAKVRRREEIDNEIQQLWGEVEIKPIMDNMMEETGEGKDNEIKSLTPWDIFQTVATNRGQVVVLDEEMIQMGRLVKTTGGGSPGEADVSAWLHEDERLCCINGYWVEKRVLEIETRCWEKMKACLGEQRLIIVNEREEGTVPEMVRGSIYGDVRWLSPGENLMEQFEGGRHRRDEREWKKECVGLKQAHWWTGERLEMILDQWTGLILMALPSAGVKIPGYPARYLWGDDRVQGSAGNMSQIVVMDDEEQGKEMEQMMLPLQTRNESSHRQTRTMGKGFYRNGYGFHATADEFVRNFCYDVMLYRQVFMVVPEDREERERWNESIRACLQQMGVIGEKVAGNFKGVPWRVNERIGWQRRRHSRDKRDKWNWGEVIGAEVVSGQHGLWVESWKGEWIFLREHEVENIQQGYVIQAGIWDDRPGVRCHYYIPRSKEKRGGIRRQDVSEVLQIRPAQAQILIGVEPYRRRWYAPPHQGLLAAEKTLWWGGGERQDRKRLWGLFQILWKFGGGVWEVESRKGTIQLNLVNRRGWDEVKEGSSWEMYLLGKIQDIGTIQTEKGMVLGCHEHESEERWVVLKVKHGMEVQALRRGGIEIGQVVGEQGEGWEVWIRRPKYNGEWVGNEVIREYVKEICGVGHCEVTSTGKVPSGVWQSINVIGKDKGTVLERVPVITRIQNERGQGGLER